jgi:hypothetical protein
MKLLIAFTMSVMFLAAADGPVKVLRPMTIPKGAVESEPGSFHYTAPDGKKWIYRKTPFGIARIPDEPAAAKTVTPDSGADVKAFDAGDSVRFERPGPFGVYRWQTRKSELSEMERAAWDRARGN